MNYLYFLEKIKLYILPFADVLAWCLMPNHFHLMLFVTDINRVTPSHPVIGEGIKKQTFYQSIAVLLRSYTRAINKQQGFSGSLFREGTKAECVTKPDGITPSFFNTGSGAKINRAIPEKQYPQLCFDYIHQNPVKSRMVRNATDWEFSSARDYAGMRDGKLINKERAKEYVKFTV